MKHQYPKLHKNSGSILHWTPLDPNSRNYITCFRIEVLHTLVGTHQILWLSVRSPVITHARSCDHDTITASYVVFFNITGCNYCGWISWSPTNRLCDSATTWYSRAFLPSVTWLSRDKNENQWRCPISWPDSSKGCEIKISLSYLILRVCGQ